MTVVNDIAELRVTLMKENNKLLTNNEEKKQYLLVVVKGYRRKETDRKNETLFLKLVEYYL